MSKNTGKKVACGLTLDGKFVELLADDEGNLFIIPRPRGNTRAKGSITTGLGYTTIAELTITNGKTFNLAKIAISCETDSWVKVRWNGTDVSIEYLVTGGIPFTDWFPWNWYPMEGDGSKKVDIQAKHDGVAGECSVELVGEES